MRCNSIHAFINIQAATEVPGRDFMTTKTVHLESLDRIVYKVMVITG